MIISNSKSAYQTIKDEDDEPNKLKLKEKKCASINSDLTPSLDTIITKDACSELKNYYSCLKKGISISISQ